MDQEKFFNVAAGIDVHKETLVVSIRTSSARHDKDVETRTFGTFHDEIVEMVAWLDEHKVEVVGLESTGVYWKPAVRALRSLSPKRVVWLVNPAEVKRVPGRKTDVSDSQWLARLVMHGLVNPSFVPTLHLDDLRKLTRFRVKLIGEQTSQKNRIIKELEASGVKLASVCSEPLGASGRAMIQALVEGSKTPAQIADLARGLLRKKLVELERAVSVPLGEASRFILRTLLEQLAYCDRTLEAVDEQIRAMLEPYQKEASLLDTVPGINAISTAAIIAEIGPDMSVFESSKHLTAWAGLCPGSNESGGKPKHAPARKGNKYSRRAAVQSAWCAVRKKGSFWKAKFGSLCKRLGPKKAIVAIARKMLVAIYHMLRDGKPYEPPPPRILSEKEINRRAQQHLKALAELGVHVTAAIPAKAEAYGA
jgi:transposase